MRVFSITCNKEDELGESKFEAEANVPKRKNTQISNFSLSLNTPSEPTKIGPGMSPSEMQMALSDRLLPTANTVQPLKAIREVEIPTRFAQNFIHSSVKNEEEEPFLYKKSLKSSSAGTWLDAMQEDVQNLYENETRSIVKAPYDKQSIASKMGIQNLKK